MTETEKAQTKTISLKPSEIERIDNFAWACRKNFSELIRDLVMPRVEEWEKNTKAQPQGQK